MKRPAGIKLGYESANRAAAMLILKNPGRYGDEDSGLVRWARMFLQLHPEKQEQPELFELTEAR